MTIRTAERRPRFVKEVSSALRMVGFPSSFHIPAEGSEPEGSRGGAGGGGGGVAFL